jgi:hypothetical protein
MAETGRTNGRRGGEELLRLEGISKSFPGVKRRAQPPVQRLVLPVVSPLTSR